MYGNFAANVTLVPAPVNYGKMPPQPNTALFCTILTLTTFIIAYYLRIFRNGKFLGRSVSAYYIEFWYNTKIETQQFLIYL